MEYILKILNKELKEREERAIENYKKLNDLENQIKKLQAENIMLRNDLKELSKEHFNK